MADIRIQPVILSGGAGTRLWPASRAATPKQFQPLLGGRSPFAETLDRFAGPAGDLHFAPPITICGAAHAEQVRAELAAAGMAGAPLVIEPMGRNTAPCAAIAAQLTAERGEGWLTLLAPADHRIGDLAAFHAAMAEGARAAMAGRVVTFGAAPDAPVTGYGYIRRGAAIDGGYAVDAFVEKPDQATAQSYLEDGRYDWNCGIFLFAPNAMAAEMRAHCPDILDAAGKALTDAGRTADTVALDADAFAACRAESLDYALMEKTDAAAVTPVAMDWSDLGSWSQIWALSDKDDAGNAVPAEAVAVDSGNCLVQSDGPAVALLGVEDLVVVVRDGAVLVARRDRSQDVKKVIAALKADGRDDLL